MDYLTYFKDAVVAGLPLTLVVFGWVAYLKKRGVQGNALLDASLISGLVIGALYMVSKTKPPVGDWWVQFVYWFAVAVYGLGLGLLASGCYEGVRFAVTSALNKLNGPKANTPKG